MIKKYKNTLYKYFEQLDEVDLDKFNRFIINNLMTNILRFKTLIPAIATIGIIIFSFTVQESIYIFIPQNNITAFAMCVLLCCMISFLLLTLYPLVIILLINYLGYQIRHILKRTFFPVKIMVLAIIFYVCVMLMTHKFFGSTEHFYMTILWLSLYFMLLNFYIIYNLNY